MPNQHAKTPCLMVQGCTSDAGKSVLAGYRIHMGVTHGPAMQRPSTTLGGTPEGAISDDGQILATYCHGLFDQHIDLTHLMRTWRPVIPIAVGIGFFFSSSRQVRLRNVRFSAWAVPLQRP